MNRNVGASFSLSVLTVLTFAVVLYQPDAPPVRSVSKAAPSPPAPREAAEIVEAHEPPVSAPASVVVGNTVATPAVAVSRPAVPVVSRTVQTAGSATAPRPVSRREVVRPPVAEPRGAFTRVRRGETLADVARRVYGTDDAESLWKSNRDLIDGPAATPGEGTLLRTP